MVEREKEVTDNDGTNVILSKNEEQFGESRFGESPLSPNEWWLVEIWKENKKAFEALVVHMLVFLFLIGALLLIHALIDISNLSQQRKETLEVIDFYAIALALVIFSVSFIIELAILVLRKIHHGTK